MRILIVGASGYIGGRLVPALARLGHELTLASRDPGPLAQRFPTTRVVRADLLDPASLGPAVEGIEVAYYLAAGGSRLFQTAFFEPKGVLGLAYWYLLYPARAVIFRGMIRVLVRRATVRPTGTRAVASGPR